jgi:hypothetical protein
MIKSFYSNETFGAYYQSCDFVKSIGLFAGSMERDKPIGISYEPIGKWRHITRQEKKALFGVLISSDFRGNAVELIIFDEADPNPY